MTFFRLQLSGGSSTCEVSVSGVNEEDRGSWRCVMSDNRDYVIVQREIVLGVGIEAQLGWGEEVRRGELQVSNLMV